MKNEINEDYCSFEVSKLLKEKGFDVWCKSHYELAVTSKKDKQDGYSGSFGWKKGECNIQSDNNSNTSLAVYYTGKHWYACSRPTHSLAIKWIRENFDIHFYVEPIIDEKEKSSVKYDWFVLVEVIGEENFDNKPYHTFEEATEAALSYILTNLV